MKNKKSDTFPQKLAEKAMLEESDSAEEPKTPATTSHGRGKSKVQATPFYSAVNCSKCRFDKLETSSYWIGQIKLAESVGKHFVASGFFKLALKSHAEVCVSLSQSLFVFEFREIFNIVMTEYHKT